jgi:hypothetical protein
MAEDLVACVRAVPEEAFREPPHPLEGLTHLERLRWLQETARFVWKHRGAARRDAGSAPSGDR